MYLRKTRKPAISFIYAHKIVKIISNMSFKIKMLML